MINFKIKDLLKKNNISRYKFQKYTNWNYKRVNAFYFGKVKDIKTAELETLCKLFKCNIQDIIEYNEDETN